MVLNTRNFLLYLLCVGFLVIAITATAIKEKSEQSASVVMSELVPANEVEYTAEAIIAPALDRETKVANMREKVLALGESVISAPAEVPVVVPVIEAEEVTPAGALLCADYQADSRLWNPGKVEFKVVEGARILYREVMATPPGATTTEVTYLEQESLLQLPLRFQSLPIESCLKTDVIGVALDGSLIRNNELTVYSIFGAETLIGYALDGFPIYGNAPSTKTDHCGGVMINGQYQYYLKSDRGLVLNCFAGIPVEL